MEPKATPSHYDKAITPIDYIMANEMNFCEGNVIKYISRYKEKNGYEDLCKCVHYVLFLMQTEYGLSGEKVAEIMNILKQERRAREL